jgi:hypothetical protein
MLSLALARKLKAAGLLWVASDNDYFAIPDRGMDDRVFVLADMQAQLDVFRGWPVVTFHGTAEWALDYILTSEVVWIPREDQMISLLLTLLPDNSGTPISLNIGKHGSRCTISWGNRNLSFEAATVADAYGQALLFALQ